MKKKRTTQSARARRSLGEGGFLNLRASIALLIYGAAACSMLSGALLAFFRPEAPAKVSERPLSFTERVDYQRAIEEVYWLHRIWPRSRGERPDPKPSLDTVMSQAQLEKKVADYLRKSRALENYWQRPITAVQLQAEMDRMAQHTKQPEVLRELFAALGNDPFLIAECLARPAVAERLVTNVYANDQEPLDSGRAENRKPKLMAAASANYTLPAISGKPNGCIDDTWTATSTTNAPSARDFHTSVWTGSEMIVWGGSRLTDSSAGIKRATGTWTPTTTTTTPKA